MTEYKWLYEDGEVCACDSCEAVAPLLPCADRSIITGKTTDYKFCEACAKTYAGNAKIYGSSQYPHGAVMQHCCRLYNMLLDKLTGREPPPEEKTDG